MAKAEWGTKRRCLSCSAAFYDMNRTPILCPKCGAEFNPEALIKTRRPTKPEEVKPTKVKPLPEVVVDADVDDADLGDDILEDADEFEEEDVAEEIDVDAEPDSDEER